MLTYRGDWVSGQAYNYTTDDTRDYITDVANAAGQGVGRLLYVTQGIAVSSDLTVEWNSGFWEVTSGSNQFYNNSDTDGGPRLSEGTLATATEVEEKFNSVAAGFDEVEVRQGNTLNLTADDYASDGRDLSELSGERSNKIVGFSSSGNIALLTNRGTYRGAWTTATLYGRDDTVKDVNNDSGFGVDSILVCIEDHTSTNLTADASKWDTFVETQELNSAIVNSRDSSLDSESWATRSPNSDVDSYSNGTPTPISGARSSAHYSSKSQEWAQSATTPTDNNGNPIAGAQSSKTSANAALVSANNAGGSEFNALNSANAAANSETAAGTSETNAGNSESAASTSESNAASSASSASSSSSSAASSASNAAGSASAASTSATDAEAAASTSIDAEIDASAAAIAAGTSETNAGSSASNALASEAMAHKWSDNPEDVPVQSTEFSAYHWAKKSESSAVEGPPGPAATIQVGSTDTLSPGSFATVVNEGSTSAAQFSFGIPEGLKGDTGDTGVAGAAATITVESTTTGGPGTNAVVTDNGSPSAASLAFTVPEGLKGDTGDTGLQGAKGDTGDTGADGQVVSVVGGTNITVDSSDPGNPIVNGPAGAFLHSTDPLIISGTIKEVIYSLTGLDLNPSNGSIQYKVLSAPVVLTESIQSGECITLRIVNGATHGVTWPTISWIKGIPTLTDADVLVFWKEQAVTYGVYAGAIV